MLETLYNIPFQVLEVPNLKIKHPTWLQMPSAMAVFSVVMFSYFLVTGGELDYESVFNFQFGLKKVIFV